MKVVQFVVEFGMNGYAYCTDFVINLANLLHLSYYEINFWVFCVVYPFLLISLPVLFFVQQLRLKILAKGAAKQKVQHP